MDKYKEISDEELVEQIRTDDQEQYAQIVKRYQGKLLRYASGIVKDDQLSEDIVQETFIKAFKNLNNFNTDKKFSSWIYRIAHNESLNIIRRSKKTVSMGSDFEVVDDVDVLEDYSKKETTRMVKKCLNKMPLIYSEVLILYFLENKKYDEISDILRLQINTVGTRISRAKLLIKKICQKNN